MLRVDHARWGQTPTDLRRLAMSASHPRTRERFLALYEITQESCATRVAERTRRHPQTVMEWLHLYNTRGPEAISAPAPPLPGDRGWPRRDNPCRPTLRRSPAGSRSRSSAALRRLVGWVRERFGRTCCRETIRAALHRLGLSWKKKLLGRADPERRRAFVERIQDLLAGAQHDRHLLVYLDEAHIHQDADLGYGWSERGRRLWVASHSPRLSDKLSFYGLYLYNEGQVRLWPYARANGEHTVDVLRRLRTEWPS
jgi:transposase